MTDVEYKRRKKIEQCTTYLELGFELSRIARLSKIWNQYLTNSLLMSWNIFSATTVNFVMKPIRCSRNLFNWSFQDNWTRRNHTIIGISIANN
ncbi:Protein CBG27822 [Caenorhabditis briggsae]|uniref:Protein CBG27822 n=1 Tax=Caenorhabditis briggsae TaxID=6238 RepID=B6IKA4_CAEBR|nr:Protein CBG27822 [Caenorhabditis briggsae]CAS00334.1 Protein CBG27822 [Caenorhabditis briggsae]